MKSHEFMKYMRANKKYWKAMGSVEKISRALAGYARLEHVRIQRVDIES